MRTGASDGAPLWLRRRWKRRGSGPTYPLKMIDGGPADGMSLRDYYAGQAMIAVAMRWQGAPGDIDKSGALNSAQKAYLIADAMLEARKR